MNILHITPDFNYCCGRSKYVFLLAKYFSQKCNKVLILSNNGNSFDRLTDINVKYILSDNLISKNPIKIFYAIIELHKIVTENKINIIHCHHRYNDFIVSLYKRFINKEIRTTTTVLSMPVGRKYISYKAGKLIAVSNSVRLHLMKYFNIKDNRIIIINHFIEPLEKPFNFDNNTQTNNKLIKVLGVGRFHPEKNFSVLIDACSRIKGNKILLTLIGEGHEKHKYIFEAKEKGCDLVLIDTVKDLSYYYETADICVLPSKVDPFPHFMLESGIYGKPFIGSNIDGIKELIINGKNGFCFELNNVDELVSKLELLINDVNLRTICGNNLKNDIIQNYLPDNIIPKIEYLYDSLIND